MKMSKIKSAKRILSLCLALVLLIGSLFTANVGVVINADAATIDSDTIKVWDGSTYTEPTTTDESGNIIIETAEQLAWVCVKASNANSYKVKDGINAFVMQNYNDATVTEFINLSNADAVKTWFESGSYTNCNWIQGSTGEFAGTFNGNNAIVYGLYGASGAMFGLFPYVNGATIKNVIVKNCYANAGSSYAGAMFGRGNWSGTVAITVENCTITNNYMYSTTAIGAVGGHAANNPAVIRNCLITDNNIDTTASWIKAYVPFVSQTNATSGCGVYNTITDNASRNSFTTTYENVYVKYIDQAKDGVATLTEDSMKGVSAKINMTGLNWATDTTDGDWYVIKGDYPLPYKPDGWVDLEIPDVWDGSAASEFAGGKGTKDDPYIIETAAQLRKMVLDGGRIDTGKTKVVDNNGTKVTVKVYEKAYYKVADGVTDIYLNPVVDGTLETIKSLASAGNAINWTQGLFDDASFKADTDGDGIRDQATAFRGEFDGNGATIHGLYSKTIDRSWNNEGVGFVPALMDDAVIKNVTFDKAYVHNTSYTYAGVITASLGYDDTKTTNTDLDPNASGGQNINGSTGVVTSVGIHNVTVRNSRVQTNSTSGFGGVAGFVASHGTPVACCFTNCLFDDSNELVTPDGGSYSSGASTGKAGFVNLGQDGTTHFYLENCVSLGVHPDNQINTKVVYTNCYTTVDATNDGLEGNLDTTELTMDLMPALNWTQWSLDDNGKLSVTGKSAAYSEALNWNEAIAYCNESRWSLNSSASSAGNWKMGCAYEAGTYINYEDMMGSGTANDPYLISDALTLARVIGSGGMHRTEKLYFKLTNDINVGGLRWITTEDYAIDADGDGVLDDAKYHYVPFEGVLDGDGYAVTNLFAYDVNGDYAGLIPYLNGGTVKNLHVRNAYINEPDNFSSALVGFAEGGIIDACSVENYVSSSGNLTYAFLGEGDASITNTYGSYIGEYMYIDANGDEAEPEIDGTLWYQGFDGTPKLVNRAKAMPYADIDGDGEGYAYGSGDIAALQSKLLKVEGYENIYADVSKNGKVNSSDLVILKRTIIGDYGHIADGFWRNVALGNIAIYYGENDNYDAARKLELYLENAVPGVDIIKNVYSANGYASGDATPNAANGEVYVHANDGTAAPGSQLAVVVGNVGSYTTGLTGNNYGITYNAANGVLWLQGANFTGVEQAVLDFIANSDVKTNTVHTVDSATLSAEKQPKTVNGVTYYYAWGDEFDVETSDNSIVKNIWEYGEMGSESENGADSKYMNLESADANDYASLYEVANGKLTIWRGLDSEIYNEATHGWGYKPVTFEEGSTTAWGAEIEADDKYASAGTIKTQDSLLVKQGYLEIKASLPNDGHAFPAWWLFGAPGGGQNRTYDSSLYSKVYKLNPNWTGINAMHGAYPNTYKYQIPTAYLEHDIVELMQDISFVKEFNSSWENFWGSGMQPETHLTGVDRTKFNLTIHKWYEENVDDNTLYVIDWDKWLNNRTAPTAYTLTDNGGTFDTSVSGGQFITRWGTSMKDIDMSSLSNLAAEHIYGYEWVADESANTFKVTVYVDGVAKGSWDQSAAYYESAESKGGTYVKDGEVYNQYCHFILDNHFYSANQEHKNGTTEYSDLLTYESGDKATWDIDYIRVYQENDKRDIITPETEDFNNGNHFGYGE